MIPNASCLNNKTVQARYCIGCAGFGVLVLTNMALKENKNAF
jgi:hypothetical protein